MTIIIFLKLYFLQINKKVHFYMNEITKKVYYDMDYKIKLKLPNQPTIKVE